MVWANKCEKCDGWGFIRAGKNRNKVICDECDGLGCFPISEKEISRIIRRMGEKKDKDEK